MSKNYRELGKQAEDAVRSIKDRDLRREAFRILFLQFMAESKIENGRIIRQGNHLGPAKHNRIKEVETESSGKKKSAFRRPGRRGGGVATVVIQKLIDAGSFRVGRDAAGIMGDLRKRHIRLEPSQLRMVLLRFSRSGKLKRRVKMKGQKITYLYSTK